MPQLEELALGTHRRWFYAWGGLILLAGCGQSGSSPLDTAQARYRAGDWDGVVAACDEALRESPESIDALLLRGRARMAAAQAEAAVSDFADVIRLAPDNPEGYYQRSLAYEALGKSEESAADKNYARGIDRQDAELLRRHAETIKMPELVRSEPDKKKPAAESKGFFHDEPRREDDSYTGTESRTEPAATAEPAADKPFFSPLTEPSIVGRTSLFDSPIFQTPLVGPAAKSPASPASGGADENDESKADRFAKRDAGQPNRAEPPLPRGGPNSPAEPEPIRIHGRPYAAALPTDRGSPTSLGRQRGELGPEVPTWRQPKYPTSRLNFSSPPGVPSGGAKPGTTQTYPSPGGPQRGSPLTSQPPAGSYVRPLILAPQLRGFTPDSPPLPLVPPRHSLAEPPGSSPGPAGINPAAR
jgi:hypothetical protein